MSNPSISQQWLEKLKLQKFPEPDLIPLQHPVLLCHGYGALASLTKPSPLYDVALLMRTRGVMAFAPNTVPYATIETRAETWAGIIRELVEKQEVEKLNIVAHSMGGLDMRYALAKCGIEPYTASLTTVSTPHRGTSLAELMLKTPDILLEKLAGLFDWMGNQMYPEIRSDARAAVSQLTRNYIDTEFNPHIKDPAGLPVYSWSAAAGKGTDTPITPLSRFQNGHIHEEEGVNDGFVSVESARWGEHILTAKISHLEQINIQLAEDRKPVYESFWEDVLRLLSARGH